MQPLLLLLVTLRLLLRLPTVLLRQRARPLRHIWASFSGSIRQRSRKCSERLSRCNSSSRNRRRRVIKLCVLRLRNPIHLLLFILPTASVCGIAVMCMQPARMLMAPTLLILTPIRPRRPLRRLTRIRIGMVRTPTRTPTLLLRA